ncbi:MAG: hypothetical protein U1G07_18905 [Verrucomicrobiota bacterium]
MDQFPQGSAPTGRVISLILANCGYSVENTTSPHPSSMASICESGWSHGRTENWTEVIKNAAFGITAAISREISLIERFEETREGGAVGGRCQAGINRRPIRTFLVELGVC